mmetsp:Transcript_6251/g.12987  ORF Transcript_6251/g.12987 Transcript_6251/m.12987 type:complete len:180 (-) Transcript_6251:96-635(-)
MCLFAFFAISCAQNYRSGSVALHDVHSVWEGYNSGAAASCNPGESCCGKIPYMTLGLPSGSELAHVGGGKHTPPNKMLILVADEASAAQVVRQAKDAASQPYAQPYMPMAQEQVIPNQSPIVVQAVPAAQVMDRDGSAGGLTSELVKLADLKAQGLLSEQEFETAKAQVLARSNNAQRM